MPKHLKILVNDHAGHPFPTQLSRALAARGHHVLHTYCGKLQGPRGELARLPQDPPGLRIQAIDLGKPFNKYGLFSRALQERNLGRMLRETARAFNPEVVISANTPLGVQAALLKECRKSGARFIFWLQDLLGVGIRNNVEKKIPLVGKPVGWLYIGLERCLLRKSDAVIAITEDFIPIVSNAGVAAEKIHVVHNWAPMGDIPCLPKSNSWSRKHRIHDKFCFVYTGTLGMKHNPGMLVELARAMATETDVRVVVVTEGLGAEFLHEQKERHRLDNLIILPFQPFGEMPSVLASADVLIALLEPDAGAFAVPSKVLTYLCGGRPLLLAVPAENLAARTVMEARAGIVVHPSDTEAFLVAARELFHSPDIRATMGENGRKYAESKFDVDRIATRFEGILAG